VSNAVISGGGVGGGKCILSEASKGGTVVCATGYVIDGGEEGDSLEDEASLDGGRWVCR